MKYLLTTIFILACIALTGCGSAEPVEESIGIDDPAAAVSEQEVDDIEEDLAEIESLDEELDLSDLDDLEADLDI